MPLTIVQGGVRLLRMSTHHGQQARLVGQRKGKLFHFDSSIFVSPVDAGSCPGVCVPRRALPDNTTTSAVDIRELSNIITARELESGEQHHVLEQLSAALGEPLAALKNMAFRQKALLSLEPAQVQERINQVAQIVEVSYEKARQMCVIQPSLLTDTQRQAEALSYGLRIICHDLRAPRDEIVDLIIINPSLLHGRSIRLSAADMAHLALLREPKGRIVD